MKINPESRIPNPESSDFRFIEDNKISFLITFYNQKEYIHNALNHILKIKIPNGFQREILIGDDGSHDGSLKIFQHYLNQYPEIQLFQISRNQNPTYSIEERASFNRLNLLKNARGKYFLICDGDDFFHHTDFLLSAIPILENDSHLSVFLFCFHCLLPNHQIEPCIIPNLKEGKQSGRKYIQNNNYIHASAAIYKTPNPKELDFLIKMNSFDDNHILISFLNFGQMYFKKEFIYTYKIHGGLWQTYSPSEQILRNALSFGFLSFYFPKYQDDFKKRFFNDLNFVFHNRAIYLNEKADFYFQLCQNEPYYFVYDILRFDDLSLNRQKEIKDFFKIPFFEKLKQNVLHFKSTFKQNLKNKKTKCIHFVGQHFPNLKKIIKKILY